MYLINGISGNLAIHLHKKAINKEIKFVKF